MRGAAAGTVSATFNWQQSYVYVEGSMSYEYRLSCIPGLSSLPLGSSTVTLTIGAGFKRLPGDRRCPYSGFSRGVPFFYGDASLFIGTSSLNFQGTLSGRLLLGVVCSDAQYRGSSVQAGISLVLYGKLQIPWVGATDMTYYIEPSAPGVCGQYLSSPILPAGTGLDTSDGVSYNLINTNIGTCY
jgi:hypothetical protein